MEVVPRNPVRGFDDTLQEQPLRGTLWHSLCGRIALVLVAVCACANAPASAQSVAQLDITTSGGCGAGVIVPPSPELTMTVSAVGIPEGRGVTVHLTRLRRRLQGQWTGHRR